MGDEIFFIIIGAIVDIVLTVFLIDRIIVWRQKKKWNDAKSMFISYGKRQSDEIIGIWKEWLVGMSTIKQKKLDQMDLTVLIGMGYYTADTGATMILKGYLGNPIGTKLDSIVRYPDRKRDSEIIKLLVPYLTTVLHSQKQEDWNRLGKRLKNPVDKLSKLVGRYSTLVDPKFAASVLRLSIEVENLLESKYSELDSKRTSSTNRIAKATVIGYGIDYSFQLSNYINKNNK